MIASHRLIELLRSILAEVAALEPASCADPNAADDFLRVLRTRFPFEGTLVQAIGTEIRRGIDEGTLCNHGDPQARFSRICKASPDTHELSVDIVSLAGTGLRHTHPRGEITLGFTAEGTPLFDGHPPGWVFMPPGSTHTPTVEGGRMHLLYLLPGGAVQWHRE